MSKEIYHKTLKMIINGTLADRFNTYRSWYYEELPSEQRKSYDDFDEFFDSPIIYGWSDIYLTTFWQRKIRSTLAEKTFTKKNFKKAEYVESFLKVDSSYSIKDLMERLSADDFIAYCKDHNLTICSMS